MVHSASSLCFVVGLFPGHEFIIRRLFANDPDFRSACDDYLVAQNARTLWASDEARRREYEDLIQELRSELLEKIERPAR